MASEDLVDAVAEDQVDVVAEDQVDVVARDHDAVSGDHAVAGDHVDVFLKSLFPASAS